MTCGIRPDRRCLYTEDARRRGELGATDTWFVIRNAWVPLGCSMIGRRVWTEYMLSLAELFVEESLDIVVMELNAV